MRLEQHNGVITAPGKRTHERVNAESTSTALVKQGYRPAIARAIAYGGLVKMIDVLLVARMAGLLTIELDTARAKGLVL
jgi:hypothetical protein